MLFYKLKPKLYLSSFLFRYKLEEISELNVLRICHCLLRLFTVLELVDVGYSSSRFKTFLFSQNIKLVDKGISIESIEKDFNDHISRNWNEIDIAEAINAYEKNLLVFINEYLYSQLKGVKFDFAENVNIEHIMPASGNNISTIRVDAGITDKDEFYSIVNRLGNKILLEEKINKSIGNEWFKTKKQTSINNKSGYKDSKYSIALDLTEYPNNVWTKGDIEIATDKAVKRIVNFIFNKVADDKV